MHSSKPIRRIAIVGTGVIGASWAAYYLSRGFDVVATDPAANAEPALRCYVDDAWGALSRAGLSAGASRVRLSFAPNMTVALAEADFVQENAPEGPDFKAKLFADMDQATPPGFDSRVELLHLGVTHTLHAIDETMANEVYIPIGATCCGTAGDRGLLHPELVRSATRDEKAGLDENPADAYIKPTEPARWECARQPVAPINRSSTCSRS